MTNLQNLAARLEGELHTDDLHRMLYSTDGSIYKQKPLGVALPRNESDLKKIVRFAADHRVPLIPRTAGTSLAGQVVGEGLIVDVSKYLNQILELNVKERWVRVQPGVIRDELNAFLKPHGLFFGPNTSTASRCMLGGMLGNNSCGTTSIKYGVTRDKVTQVKTLLSDGSEATFGPNSPDEFQQKCIGDTLENRIYRQLRDELSNPEVQEEIRREYPKPNIHRRNTGYALDILLNSNVFTPGGPDINLSKLLAGSEGTLAITAEITFKLDPLPPPEEVLLCAHFNSLDEAMQATLVAMQYEPYGCELMDKIILDCTKENREQQKNRFFLQGDPAAVLIIEHRGPTRLAAEATAYATVAHLRTLGLGYAFPLVYPPDTPRVLALRAAGFGVLSNIKSDRKPLEFVEDTAVDLADLPAYIREFGEMMETFNQRVVYYAHAGAGELHLRPSVNLKTEEGVREMEEIAEATARLVKKYGGSLSGEHGDGRVRGPFIPIVLGQKNYELLKRVKQTWDPNRLFNPGKITDTAPMTENLRHEVNPAEPHFDTAFDFSAVGGILHLAEKCNGSGDCRKLNFSGGVMCPSYRATRDEKDATRGRANALREVLTMNVKENPFDHPALHEAMDLCLSCKGCTSECPSNVDMAALKAEYQHQLWRKKGIPLKIRAIANIDRLNALGMWAPGLANRVMRHPKWGAKLKAFLEIAPERSLPALQPMSLRKWFRRNRRKLRPKGTPKGRVYFFCDEFTNYNDTGIGIKAVELLSRLGYDVRMPGHAASGRAAISKGLLLNARKKAAKNVRIFGKLLSEDTPLVGLEPSAILSFRDEYPRLLRGKAQAEADRIAPFTLMIEEFLAREAKAGRIGPEQFTREPKKILLHGHCHQKALASVADSAFVLALPENWTVSVIPSGCCGMAGSFGYEKDHYDLSMQIGEMVLMPAVREADADTLIAAPGTSCRHQILDGAGRKAVHPVEGLWGAVL
ncbi:MAG: FAD-binding protein [Lewinellaceae bacterium]|nr:FAD-binding protein [Lewinellaceae bacterium]